MSEMDKNPSVSPKNAKANEHSGVLQSGQIIGGKYNVVHLLGKGGMGSVYLVKQMFLQKDYALKTLESQNSSEVAVRRFQIEAKAASNLNHPNLVQVHDFGLLDNGEPYLVMDFVEGETLAALIKEKGQLETVVALKIFSQVCLGLAFAHQQGVVHRDIKPSNIMLVKDAVLGTEGCVKVVDFGIAKLTASEDGEIQALTKTGEIFGSPLYMSPEQCTGTSIDFRTDIYSLGCVLYEALTGAPPHLGETALSTMIQHQSNVPLTLKQAALGRDYPAKLEEIVEKMLAKNPAERYQNLGTVALELSSLFEADSAPAIEKAVQKLEAKTSKTVTLKVRDLTLFLASLALLFGFFGAFVQSWISSTKIQESQKVVKVSTFQEFPPTSVAKVSANDKDEAIADEKEIGVELDHGLDVIRRKNIANDVDACNAKAIEAQRLQNEHKVQEATIAYKEALDKWPDSREGYPAKFQALLNYGDFVRDTGKNEDAKKIYLQAQSVLLKYDKPTNDANSLVFLRLGILATWAHNFKEAEKYIKQALALKETKYGRGAVQTLDELTWMGNLYIHPNVARRDEALHYYERADAIATKQGAPGKRTHAVISECEGICLFGLKKYELALKKFLIAKKAYADYAAEPSVKNALTENAIYTKGCKESIEAARQNRAARK